MRIVGEIPNADCKITLYSWNNRYLIKMEAGYFEQTFKIDEFDVSGDDEIKQIIDDTFVQEAIQRFHEMAQSLGRAMHRS